MKDFSLFCNKHINIFNDMVHKAERMLFEEINDRKLINPAPSWQSHTIHEYFINECQKNKELMEHGFIILHGTGKCTHKFLLYHPEENILIRFGKMTSRYCLAKCNTNFDKQFARQEQELFTDMPRTINMHLGYTTSKKTGLINEIILAIPLSQKTNASIYLFSEKDQKEFPIQQNSVQKSGNGFKEKLLSDNNKTETEIK